MHSPNMLLTPSSTGRHPAADTTDWSGRWVAVGLAGQLTESGAVLPATIGYHAVHVRRTGDGPIAAFNARPFGGCLSVPVHCGSTRNVKCPHLACAFSADSGVLDSATDPSGAARTEFIGDGRRSVRVPLAQWGPVLFVNVTLTEPPPLQVGDVPVPTGRVVASGSRPVPGNWLGAAVRAASDVAGVRAGSAVVTVEPNLAMVRHGPVTYLALSRPAGHTRSTLVWARLSAAVKDC